MMQEREPDNIVMFMPKRKPDDEPETLVDCVTRLMGSIEEVERGMKLMIDVIAQHDLRLRAIELALRKIERKNVPVIVNAQGERAN